MLNLPNFKYQNQKFLLSITRFVHFHGLASAVAIIGLLVMVGSIANAQTISSAVGLPDMDPSSPWYGVCSTNPDPPAAPGPNATSQLKACSAANPSECLQRVTIPMNNFPNATCNDGSPGIFYVRPGAGKDANKWIIHTQGGGSCGDYDTCLERWCGQQGNVPYSANKMSSDWDGDGVINLHPLAKAEGMSKYSPGNDFNDWTHVWMYYCSSDSWMGRANNVPYIGGTPFTIHHRGHTILSAARRMLRKNAVSGWTTDEGYTTPDLDNATHVVFTGTSAGAKGALHNVDWFMKPLSAPNKYFILDANMDNLDTVLINRDIWVDEDGDGIGDQLYYSKRIEMGIDSWTTGYLSSINAFTDKTCRDWYEPLGRMDRCSYFSTLLLLNIGGIPVIETPTFIRFDLEDGVASKPWKGVWPDGVTQLMIGQFGRPTTIEDHTQSVRETLEGLYDDHDTVTGVFGPRCGKHVGLEDSTAYALDESPHTDILAFPPAEILGTDTTAHEAIVDWLDISGGGGPAPIQVLDSDDVGDPSNPADPEIKFSMCY